MYPVDRQLIESTVSRLYEGRIERQTPWSPLDLILVNVYWLFEALDASCKYTKSSIACVGMVFGYLKKKLRDIEPPWSNYELSHQGPVRSIGVADLAPDGFFSPKALPMT